MSFMFFSGRFRRSPVPAVFLAASLIWAMPGNASADQAQAPGTSPAAAAIQAAPPVPTPAAPAAKKAQPSRKNARPARKKNPPSQAAPAAASQQPTAPTTDASGPKEESPVQARAPELPEGPAGDAARAYAQGNFLKARDIWQKLAEEGDAQAMNNLGVLYDQGHGVEPDTGRALHWFAQSAKAGHPSGMSNYGRMLEQGRGIAANPQEAARWFDLAARQGQPEAQYNLGLLYERGRGVPQDDKAAAAWYSRAAAQQQSESLARLGHFYRAGRGVAKNPGRAVLLLYAAAMSGEAGAIRELEEKRITVVNSLKPKIQLRGNYSLLYSIFRNLMDNAIKYNKEQGKVTVRIFQKDGEFGFSVKDTGIGIPASEQKKLFRMHFRGSNAINSKVTGSGIGLLLVWKLVRLHKGKINFNSTEGKGSCIKVIFPKKEKYYRKAVHSPKPGSEKVVYTESGVPKNISLSTVYDTARQKQKQNGDLPKILIVEDNDELREYLRNTLSDDYTIQVCSDGKQALDIVKEYMPNMIISDIMMPEMRGDELCHKLKNDIETSHIPIILLTALNNDRNIIEGLKTGADEYIVKPFNIGILRATIANILTNRSLLRHKYANLELNDEESDTACINCSTDIDWKFISTVKKSVEDNMDNSSFTVDVLCNLLNMSRTSFYNKIKALTDQAPADYIRLIRLKRAAQLLKEQQHSITEVAEMTGFSDAKYFREVFKKHFNVSPSQYAKQKEEDNNGKMI